MKLILEQWNQYVDSVDNLSETNSLEEAITFMENYLEENAELLDEDLKKTIMGGLTGLMMMAASSPSLAADLGKKQFGLPSKTYVAVIDRAKDAADNGVIDADFGSEVESEYKEIAASSRNLYKLAQEGDAKAKPYLEHYIKPAHEYINSLKNPDAKWTSEHTKAVHVFAMAKLNHDSPEEASKPEPEKERSSDAREFNTSDHRTRLMASAMNIKSSELKKPEDKEKAIAKFNLDVDEAKSAGYVDDGQSKQLKDLGAAGDAVGVDKLLKQIETSKK
jgi:hypothetical protein